MFFCVFTSVVYVFIVDIRYNETQYNTLVSI